MVKRQKEKQYQSAREHKANSQLRSGNQTNTSSVRKLPFNCCSLSLIPFTTPVCTSNGIVFEKTAIEPFLQEHKTDPVTGKLMSRKDLITLNMKKDEEGRWQCPIMTKPFADHTKIVAVRQNPPGNEANVYSWEAYQELNVKAKNYEDLTSGLKFKKTDVIILNSDDPEFQKLRDINTFYHIRNQRELEKSNKQSSGTNKNNNIRHSVTASRILDKLNKDKDDNDDTSKTNKKRPPPPAGGDLQKEGKRLKIFAEDVTGVKLTSGKGSGSLTSTAMTVSYDNEAREATDEEVRIAMFQVLRQQKKKGYVKLRTNRGDLLLEIHCDLVPRTATNFMKLCHANKYNGSSFHRLIKGFMMQGGKPAKDAGAGGDQDDDESIWGGAFRDEFHSKLNHDGPGILSMANAGPNTNRRQFFLTFKSCEYLNKKHSVFGTVVGEGLALLKELEKISTDTKDRPLEPIKIVETIIVEDPVHEAEEAERKRLEARAEARRKSRNQSRENQKKEDKKRGTTTTTTTTTTTAAQQSASLAEKSSQIGRYLPKVAASLPAAKKEEGEELVLPPPKQVVAKPKSGKKPKMKFGNFSSW